jgi:nitrite reductase/ring-hydroxylating ferredoxin subunit
MYDVGGVDEFAYGEMTIVAIENRSVGVLCLGDDEVYALLNRCPHMGGPLCEGHLGPRLAGLPGTVTVCGDEVVLSCPWHHWEFSVRTGRPLFANGNRISVKTYKARVEHGRVLVDVQ